MFSTKIIKNPILQNIIWDIIKINYLILLSITNTPQASKLKPMNDHKLNNNESFVTEMNTPIKLITIPIIPIIANVKMSFLIIVLFFNVQQM